MGRIRGKVKAKRCKGIVERDNWTCQICKEKIEDPRDLTIDHIVPLSKGGAKTDDNLQAAHRWCNEIKDDNEIADIEKIRELKRKEPDGVYAMYSLGDILKNFIFL